MSMKAIKDIYKPTNVMTPAAHTATTTSAAIDTANVNENEFVYQIGTWTDGTHTPKLQECATSGGAYTDVAAADLVGAFTAVTDNTGVGTFQAVSYIGKLQFVKMVVTRSGTTTGLVDGAFMISKKRKQP